MFIMDYLSFSAQDELYSASRRFPANDYASFFSLKGRAVCVWKACFHTAGLVIKPAIYLTFGSIFTICAPILSNEPRVNHFNFRKLGKNFLLCGLAAPLSQTILLIKAVVGILFPGVYFKKDPLSPYFNRLADMAQQAGAEQELVDLLKQGSSLVETSFRSQGSRLYYDVIVQRDLAIICEKLENLSTDQQLAVLTMFKPEANETAHPGSGIYTCPQGLVRLLEQMCASLDAPTDPEKVFPWLVEQFKLEILHGMVLQASQTKDAIERPNWHILIERGAGMQPVHQANFLILALGGNLALPQEWIQQAQLDISVRTSHSDEQEELLDAFKTLYTEEHLTTYLMKKINTDLYGYPGLKSLRNHMMQTLTNAVTEQQIDSSKEEVKTRFGVSELFADEPIFYIKLHYYLNPDADAREENSTDFNEEGIKAFAATLANNPYASVI